MSRNLSKEWTYITGIGTDSDFADMANPKFNDSPSSIFVFDGRNMWPKQDSRDDKQYDVIMDNLRHEILKQGAYTIAKDVSQKFNFISISEGAEPHIDNYHLTVSKILKTLGRLQSIDAVTKYYAPYIPAEAIRQAIIFASEFIEIVTDPRDIETQDWMDYEGHLDSYDWGDVDPDELGEPIV